MTHDPSDIRRLLDRHGLSPRRAFGQNFVVDANTVRRIARLAGVGPGDRVVEIGAGLGSLTLALAETGAEIVAVEVDRDLVPVLTEQVADRGVRVVEGDALTLDWNEVLGHPGPWHLVANLPYNVATPLVLDLLRRVEVITDMLVMVQKEVGERLVAAPGTRAAGIPSVLVAYHATGEIVGRVPAAVFHPRPRVESVLVRLRRRPAPAVDVPLDEIEPLVRTAFSQRRKMLRRSLAGRIPVERIEAAGIDPAARPEQLSLAEWAALARAARPTSGPSPRRAR